MSADLTIVADRWGLSSGGLESYLGHLAGRLAAGGVAVRILCSRGKDCRPGVNVEALGGLTRGALGEVLFARCLRKSLENTGGPVLASRPVPLATHYQLHAGLISEAFAAEAESLGGLRGALHRPVTAFNLKRRLLLAWEARLLGGGARGRRARLMVWTERLRESVCHRCGVSGVSPEDVLVSPPGVERALFDPAGPAERFTVPSFLFVAHNPVLKNLGTALTALERVRRRGLAARLLVAGRGRAAPYRSVLSRLDLAEAVDFLGEVASARLASLYRGATALVHPTFYDPCSIACLEALACGCPVISTARNGASERIVSGREGFVLADPRDADALAEAMQEAADPTRQGTLREAAARLGATYDLDEHVRVVRAWLGV